MLLNCTVQLVMYMDSRTGDVTRLLERYRAGDSDAEAELFSNVYSELHRLAAHYLRGERPDHTLQPTALVNEAYLRLVGQREKGWQNRAHFVAVSAKVMRQVLVDFARRAKAEKRDFGIAPQPLDDATIGAGGGDPALVLDLDAALTQLSEYDEAPSAYRRIEILRRPLCRGNRELARCLIANREARVDARACMVAWRVDESSCLKSSRRIDSRVPSELA